MDIPALIVLSLATWRLSSLIKREHGPLSIFDKIRYWAGVRYNEANEMYGTNALAEGMICAWCSSVWFGIALTLGYILLGSAVIWVALPLSLSAVAIIVETYLWSDRE